MQCSSGDWLMLFVSVILIPEFSRGTWGYSGNKGILDVAE